METTKRTFSRKYKFGEFVVVYQRSLSDDTHIIFSISGEEYPSQKGVIVTEYF